ncbi:MAG: carboxypeptidase regulatory-like domain-containing protein [bacterium]
MKKQYWNKTWMILFTLILMMGLCFPQSQAFARSGNHFNQDEQPPAAPTSEVATEAAPTSETPTVTEPLLADALAVTDMPMDAPTATEPPATVVPSATEPPTVAPSATEPPPAETSTATEVPAASQTPVPSEEPTLKALSWQFDGFAIYGQVIYDGSGVEGVSIADESGDYSATTDGDGNFSIENVPAGSYSLIPSKEGYSFSPEIIAVEVVDSDVYDVYFEVTERPVYTISGQITFNGSGLADVTVEDDSGTYSTTTDYDGNYVLEDVAVGNYTIVPSLDYYTFSPENINLDVVDGEVLNQNFEAFRTFAFSGWVTLDGSGLEGVTISDESQSYSATTDADGYYEINEVQPGSYTFTPSLEGYTFDPKDITVELKDSDMTDQNFEAYQGYAISGQVTFEGAGLEGVTVADDSGTYSTTTDAEGYYTLAGLPQEGYTIVPTLDGYSFSPENLYVELWDGDVSDQNFEALKNFSVSGQITFDGSPLADVTVSDDSGSASTTTDADGNYTLANVAQGTRTIVPSLDGYGFNPDSVVLEITDSDIADQNFEGFLAYNVSGRVVYNGSGLANVLVTDDSNTYRAYTDFIGNYTIEKVPVGSYTFTPSRTRYSFAPFNVTVNVVDSDISGKNFTANISLPGKATLISPISVVNLNHPLFKWSYVSNATSYRLWIYQGTRTILTQWFSYVQAHCSAVTKECNLYSPVEMGSGAYTWNIQTYNSVGFGPWGTAKTFTVAARPVTVVLVSPGSMVYTQRPPLIWNAVSGATEYTVIAYTNGRTLFNKKYTKAQTACPLSVGRCSLIVPVILPRGSNIIWQVQARNVYGPGPWSLPKVFKVR